MEELFDLYDDQGRPLGIAKERSRVHRDGDWHRSIHLWVVRGDGRLLFQQRSAGKDTMPGLLTVTVGGHYAAGEQLRDVLREAREEIGRQVHADDLIPLGQWRYEDATSDPGVIDREWQDVFFWPLDDEITAFQLDAAEVTALVELAPDALLRLLDGQVATLDGRRLRAGAATADWTTVAPTDLVPTPAYHARIAEAALVYAAGGMPWIGVEPIAGPLTY